MAAAAHLHGDRSPDDAAAARQGVVAIGNIAVGGLALGGLTLGLVAIGGLSIGIACAFGGAALGLGLSVGGFAFGSIAFGSIAVGGVAVGLKYAIGGAAFGPAVIDGRSCDEAAHDLWARWLGTRSLPPTCTQNPFKLIQ